ncbi:unnamed protein product [Discosporangium mesarthrocarpum]
MAKNKGTRIIVTLECTKCEPRSTPKKIYLKLGKMPKKMHYTTTKNRRNTPDRLELKKFCPVCNTHTLYKEIK